MVGADKNTKALTKYNANGLSLTPCATQAPQSAKIATRIIEQMHAYHIIAYHERACPFHFIFPHVLGCMQCSAAVLVSGHLEKVFTNHLIVIYYVVKIIYQAQCYTV